MNSWYHSKASAKKWGGEPSDYIDKLHIMQDLGWIPSPSDYINNMELKQWMGGPIRKEQDLDNFLPARPQPQETYYDKKPKGIGALDSWDF